MIDVTINHFASRQNIIIFDISIRTIDWLAKIQEKKKIKEEAKLDNLKRSVRGRIRNIRSNRDLLRRLNNRAETKSSSRNFR